MKTIKNFLHTLLIVAATNLHGQGTTYLSNLGQTSTGSIAVGSDSWRAESFITGTNAGGYTLDSIQLGMIDASGSPSGFTLMVYSSILTTEYFPDSNLETLNGSLNPATAGVYTFTPTTILNLLPQTTYFIVLTSGTLVADGAFGWSLATGNYGASGGWHAPAGFAGADTYKSIDGSSWTRTLVNPQFAISATAVPEPASLGLFALGGWAIFRLRRKRVTHP